MYFCEKSQEGQNLTEGHSFNEINPLIAREGLRRAAYVKPWFWLDLL